ncbi:hypothetical protein [uncultured Trichococcus sp.]|uniref:hypothetical protein n=1 Tax=uncultured Trichococcus sp. TaxID=189665 RepID=UPI002A18892C|nr:hypothetical protein [uncultured Trichococcus sp.]
MSKIDILMKQLSQSTAVKKAGYLFSSMGDRYFEIQEDKLLNKGYIEKISPALEEISSHFKNRNIKKQDLIEYFECKDGYLSYLLSETEVSVELIVLKFITKNVNLLDIFTVPLEKIPENANPKYKIVMMGDESSPNHQGIFHYDKFFYYHPLFKRRVDAHEPPMLIQQIFLEKILGNDISIRLDQTISVEKDYYKPEIKLFHELHNGKVINLDNIQISFPFRSGEYENLCVYNPKTMKKIQFKISRRKDSEFWVEVEELFPIHDTDQWYNTKYLHSIYNPIKNEFNHIDGSFNFYDKDKYNIRVNKQISAHANRHEKFWLVEGKTSVLDWAKMILYFFEDEDLIFDAFTGKLIEDVFTLK